MGNKTSLLQGLSKSAIAFNIRRASNVCQIRHCVDGVRSNLSPYLPRPE
ncbi:hypothetical protein MICRO11B_320010 [Micrococcus luteus]|nr:hypothetical protein MICRO11B_320010 [Micrococcus luteus]